MPHVESCVALCACRPCNGAFRRRLQVTNVAPCTAHARACFAHPTTCSGASKGCCQLGCGFESQHCERVNITHSHMRLAPLGVARTAGACLCWHGATSLCSRAPLFELLTNALSTPLDVHIQPVTPSAQLVVFNTQVVCSHCCVVAACLNTALLASPAPAGVGQCLVSALCACTHVEQLAAVGILMGQSSVVSCSCEHHVACKLLVAFIPLLHTLVKPFAMSQAGVLT